MSTIRMQALPANAVLHPRAVTAVLSRRPANTVLSRRAARRAGDGPAVSRSQPGAEHL